MCRGFWCEGPKERDHSEDGGVDGRMGQNRSSGDRLRGVEWIQLAQYRGRWRAVVNTVMNLRVPVSRS
jgi:hypothetical protein